MAHLEPHDTIAKLNSLGACRTNTNALCHCTTSPGVWKAATAEDLIWFLTRPRVIEGFGDDRIREFAMELVERVAYLWEEWARENAPGQEEDAEEALALIREGKLLEAGYRGQTMARTAKTDPQMKPIAKMIWGLTLDRPGRVIAVVVGYLRKTDLGDKTASIVADVIPYEEVELALKRACTPVPA